MWTWSKERRPIKRPNGRMRGLKCGQNPSQLVQLQTAAPMARQGGFHRLPHEDGGSTVTSSEKNSRITQNAHHWKAHAMHIMNPTLFHINSS